MFETVETVVTVVIVPEIKITSAITLEAFVTHIGRETPFAILRSESGIA
jgi:hypothetical protein